jgi:threonylcarbamoyladenosine tRNA methylthiotransferase MtaB
MPAACIGSDVIVGFPGETSQHFENTVAFIESLPVSYLHAFTYSERPNTLAADNLSSKNSSVSKHERNRRNRVIRSLSEKKLKEFYRQNLGTSRLVLWESSEYDRTSGTISGYTDNYVRVRKVADGAVRGQIESVNLNTLGETGCVEVSSEFDLPVIR